MEERLVNATIGLLFLGVVAVQLIKIANAWVAALEKGPPSPVVIVAGDEPDLELGPEYN
jgi:hypothetical protein